MDHLTKIAVIVQTSHNIEFMLEEEIFSIKKKETETDSK
jgi:hypothetical protein